MCRIINTCIYDCVTVPSSTVIFWYQQCKQLFSISICFPWCFCFCLSVSNSTMCTLEPSYDPSLPVSCRPYQPPLIRSPRKQTRRPTYRTHTASRLLRLVINYGEGVYKMGKIVGPKFYTPTTPPPSRQGKAFCAPLLKSGNFLSPPSIWLKLQATTSKLPQNLLCPPPPPSARLKLHMPPPPSRFAAPPPPIISDQSLICTIFKPSLLQIFHDFRLWLKLRFLYFPLK